jgi:hypothetical protein
VLIPGDEVARRRPRGGTALRPADGECASTASGPRHGQRERHGRRRGRRRRCRDRPTRRRHRRRAAPTSARRSSRSVKLRRLVTVERVAVESTRPRAVHPRHLLHRRMWGCRSDDINPSATKLPSFGSSPNWPPYANPRLPLGSRVSSPWSFHSQMKPPCSPGVRRDHVPVVGERAVRVAHRMAVLAHDQRSVAEPVAPVGLDRVDRSGTSGTRRRTGGEPPSTQPSWNTAPS